MLEPVHFHPNKVKKNANVLLLLIPTIVFALVLAVLLSNINRQRVATTSEPSVLGGETQNLDKPSPELRK